MKHIVIDLEMNKIARSSEARKICKSEIIEIGAVMLDENLQEIGNFRTYVNRNTTIRSRRRSGI